MTAAGGAAAAGREAAPLPRRAGARSLTALFAELNRSRFGGRLPAYTVRHLPFTATMARRRMRWELPDVPRPARLGDCDPSQREIRILNRLLPELEREVLLHEMCHAATAGEDPPGEFHGPRWREEMVRLATEHGETWAGAQARGRRDRTLYNQSVAGMLSGMPARTAERRG